MISRKLLESFVRSTLIKTSLNKSKPAFVNVRNFTEQKKDDFIPIYKFTFIPVASVLNKAKRWQLLATSIIIPGSYGLSLVEMCTPEMFQSIAVIGSASTVVVFAVGQFFSNMIGYIYTSENLQTVRISYSDFWGRRINEDVPKEDFIPLPNCAKYPTDVFYRRLYRYSSKKSVKVAFSMGEVLNPDAFEYIFEYDPTK